MTVETIGQMIEELHGERALHMVKISQIDTAIEVLTALQRPGVPVAAIKTVVGNPRLKRHRRARSRRTMRHFVRRKLSVKRNTMKARVYLYLADNEPASARTISIKLPAYTLGQINDVLNTGIHDHELIKEGRGYDAPTRFTPKGTRLLKRYRGAVEKSKTA